MSADTDKLIARWRDLPPGSVSVEAAKVGGALAAALEAAETRANEWLAAAHRYEARAEAAERQMIENGDNYADAVAQNRILLDRAEAAEAQLAALTKNPVSWREETFRLRLQDAEANRDQWHSAANEAAERAEAAETQAEEWKVLRDDALEAYDAAETQRDTLAKALRSAPMPFRESILDRAEWEQRYDEWWHEHASEDALAEVTSPDTKGP